MLIVFEGIDGTGKSTQVKQLATALREEGYTVITSFEPTNGTYGSQLRASAHTGRLSAEEELGLFLKDRREHVQTLINPCLENSEIVILDRYYYSTMAYQGIRGLDPDHIRQMNEAFAPAPGLLFILDLPVPEAIKRITGRDSVANEFEKADALEKCQTIFHQIVADDEPNTHLLDAQQDAETLHQEILTHVQEKLKNRNFS